METQRVRTSQNWPAYNLAQQEEKRQFMEILADLCSKIEEPEYKFGRPNNSLRDMVYCSAFKVYSTYSGRRFTSDMEIAHEKGYVSKVPHYNSIFNYLKREELIAILNDLITETSKPLADLDIDFAVDSSGFTTSTYKQWSEYRAGNPFKGKSFKEWIKAHIMCGVKTNIVTAVRLSEGHINDSPEFVPLVKKTAKNFCLREVSADMAYSSRDNLSCVSELGAIPYIPFKKTAKGAPNGCLTWAKMYSYFTLHQEEFMSHYHKRSNVESTFFMIKAKFGSRVRSRTQTAQFNEVLCKILCHNICVLIQEMHEMGMYTPQIKCLRSL